MRVLWFAPICILLLALLTFAAPALGADAGDGLAEDESLILFPSQAHKTENGWHLPVRGWVFELEGDSLTGGAIVSLFGATFDGELTEEQKKRLHTLALPFLADNERGKTLQAQIDAHSFEVGPSTPDGNLTGTVTLPPEKKPLAGGSWLEIKVRSGERAFVAPVQLIGPTGVSVISDIDDTVKITVVRDHDEMLANTFLRPFRAVEGMGKLYSGWAARGAAIHYVSGSPRQLYLPLLELFEREGFPRGGWYPRTVRVNPRKLGEALKSAAPIKQAMIEELLNRYPGRKFILVGDSGEGDPEIYAALERAYPKMIAKILIRDVTGDAPGGERYRETFAGVPESKWRLFTDGEDLAQETLPLTGQ